MVELQINITDYVHQCCGYLRDKFEDFGRDLEDFFDELEDIKKCKVGKRSYKVGEVWKDEQERWNACREGGVVEHDVNPCTLHRLLDKIIADEE